MIQAFQKKMLGFYRIHCLHSYTKDIAFMDCQFDYLQKASLSHGGIESKKFLSDTSVFLKNREVLIQALGLLVRIRKKGGHVLFVGSGEEHQILFREYVKPLEHSFITCKWLPGLLTNTTQHEFSHEMYHHLTKMLRMNSTNLQGRASILFEKMGIKYANIRNLIPDTVIFLDHEESSIRGLKECQKAGIPTIAFCQSQNYRDLVTYPLFVKPSLYNVQRILQLSCFALNEQNALSLKE